MNKLIKNALATIAATMLAAPAVASATGPEVFKAQKCTGCHTVSAAGIARRLAAGAGCVEKDSIISLNRSRATPANSGCERM